MKRQDELNEAWCKYMNKCSTEIMQALAFALRWCDDHPNWISVHEDHHPSEDRVIFVDDTATQYMGYYDWDIQMWKSEGVLIQDEQVTHWMPLPNSPVLSNLENTGKNLKGGEI